MVSPVPTRFPNQTETNRRHAEAINQLAAGNINSFGSITLTASAATTTLNDPNIGYNSKIFFMPTTANAAAALAGLYVTLPGAGTATLNHANNAQSDKTFGYVVLGA